MERHGLYSKTGTFTLPGGVICSQVFTERQFRQLLAAMLRKPNRSRQGRPSERCAFR